MASFQKHCPLLYTDTTENCPLLSPVVSLFNELYQNKINLFICMPTELVGKYSVYSVLNGQLFVKGSTLMQRVTSQKELFDSKSYFPVYHYLFLGEVCREFSLLYFAKLEVWK